MKQNILKNEKVGKVSVERIYYIDTEYKIDVELKNGGHFVVFSESESPDFAVMYIIELGCYYGIEKTLMEWGDILVTDRQYISEYFIRYALKRKEGWLSLNDIINSYKEIENYLSEVYHEPQIPGMDSCEVEDWGIIDELKKYKGYISNASHRVEKKLYVFKK
jgi:hypothetical protein